MRPGEHTQYFCIQRERAHKSWRFPGMGPPISGMVLRPAFRSSQRRRRMAVITAIISRLETTMEVGHIQKVEKYITPGLVAVRSANTSHHEPKKTSSTGTGCGNRSNALELNGECCSCWTVAASASGSIIAAGSGLLFSSLGVIGPSSCGLCSPLSIWSSPALSCRGLSAEDTRPRALWKNPIAEGARTLLLLLSPIETLAVSTISGAGMVCRGDSLCKLCSLACCEATGPQP